MPTWLAGWAPAARPLARLYAALGYRARQAMTAQRGLTLISLKSSTSRYTGVHRVVTIRWNFDAPKAQVEALVAGGAQAQTATDATDSRECGQETEIGIRA